MELIRRQTGMRSPLVACTAALLVLAGCGDDPASPPTESSPSPTATQSSGEPTPSASASPSGSPSPADGGAPVRLTVRGLPTGEPPAVPYLAAEDAEQPGAGWLLVEPDGSTTRMPDAGFTAFAPMGAGLVGISADGERPAAIVLDGSGKPLRRAAARGYSIAVSPDGRIVSWLGVTGAPQVVEEGDSRPLDLPRVPQGSAVGAILGMTTCRAESPTDGCGVVVNSADASQVWFSTSDGHVDPVGGRGMKSAVDSSPAGALVGLISLTDQGSCSGVWKNVRRPAWQTCDFTLTQFSPDGSRLLGTDPYLDGLGQRTLAFLFEGRVLRQFASPRNGPTIIQTVWEDNDHALAVVVDGRQWSVLRAGVDGSLEYAVQPVAGDEVTRPLGLPEG